MDQIKPVHVVANDERLVIIDDKGRIWTRSITGKTWRLRGELPNEADADAAHLNSDRLSLS